MNSSIIIYLSLSENKENGDITLDEDRLQYIRDEYDDLYGHSNTDLTEEQRKEETLKKLTKKLKLRDDRRNMEYLNTCVSQTTYDDAKLEIIDKFAGTVEYLDPVITTDSYYVEPMLSPNEALVTQSQIQKTSNEQANENSKKKPKPEEDIYQDVNQLTCIVYKNLDRPEVDDFMKTFLFRQVQGEDGQALE
jgi:hypothetical protein